MNEQATYHREEIKLIIKQLNLGSISYDEAAQRAQTHIDDWNKINKETASRIAKKYNMRPRHRDIKFASLVRSPELLW